MALELLAQVMEVVLVAINEVERFRLDLDQLASELSTDGPGRSSDEHSRAAQLGPHLDDVEFCLSPPQQVAWLHVTQATRPLARPQHAGRIRGDPKRQLGRHAGGDNVR